MADEPLPTTPPTPEQRLADSLDIVDPGRIAPAPTADTQGKQGPKVETIPGATVAPELLDRAARLGISADEAKYLSSATLNKLLAREPERAAQQPSVVEQLQEAGYVWDGQNWWPPQADEGGPGLADLRAYRTAAGEELEDGIVSAFEERDRHYQEKLAAIEERAARAEQAVLHQQQQQQAAQVRQDEQTFESLIAKDDDFKEVLGQGDYHAIRGTVHEQARRDVWHMMHTIVQANNRAGRSVPAADRLYQQAKAAVFPDRVAQAGIRQVQDKARNSAGQFISRPSATTRSSSGWEDLPKGGQRAEGALAEMLRNGNQG